MAVSLKSLCDCWFETSGASRVKSKTGPPYMEGKEKQKKEADHYRLVCRRFNKQGNSHTSLVLDSCMTNRSPPLLVRILRVYPETLIGFSHIYTQIDSTTHCFLKAVWDWLPLWEQCVAYAAQVRGRGEEPLMAPVN